MVQYTYDAWGNHTVTDSNGTVIPSDTSVILSESEESQSHIGNLNPFRYRSYFYDTETKLYFLQTRYYDPKTGRFISADDVSYLDPEHINGLNLYAYCVNNPVMYVDPSGTIATALFICFLIGAVIGAVAGGMIGADIAIKNGKSGWDLLAYIGLGIALGGLIGGAAGACAYFLPIIGVGSAVTVGSTVAVTAVSTVAVAAVLGGTIAMFKPHTSNQSPSKLPKHQKGESTRRRDAGGEKGDVRRTNYRKNKTKLISGIIEIIIIIISLFWG